MKLNAIFISAAAGVLMALPAAADTMIRSVDVQADLTVFDDPTAAEVWNDVENDLEDAILSRITDKIADDGSIVAITMDTVHLANSIEQALGVGESEIKGRVMILHPDNTPNTVYDLTVLAASADFPMDVVTLPISSEEYYTVMVDAFAENVADKLED